MQELLLRHEQPVSVRQPAAWIDRELVEEPATERLRLHVVLDGHVVPTEPDRPAEELLRKRGLDPVSNGIDVPLLDEHVTARSPAVVGRPRRVQAEDIRPGAHPSSRVTGRFDRGTENLLVEASRELENDDDTHLRHCEKR